MNIFRLLRMVQKKLSKIKKVFLGDKADVRGSLRITCRDVNGNIVREIEQHNLVVTSGRNALAHLTACDSPTTMSVNFLKIGTGANAEVPGDVDLQLPCQDSGGPGDYTKTWDTVAYDDGQKSVMFTFTVPTAQPLVQPVTLAEAGLFNTTTTPNGPLFSRIVHATFEKTNAVSVQYAWTIKF
jgi:hypothetical protein